MQKIFSSPAEALKGVLFDGMTIMSGGFGLSGNPESLIPEIRDSGVKNLTVISNNCGAEGFGLWMLLNNRQIKKMISSYIGENKLFEQLYLAGELELELNAARHAGRAHPGRWCGHPGFLYPHRCRHRGGGRQAGRGIRRPALCPRNLPQGGSCHHQGLARG